MPKRQLIPDVISNQTLITLPPSATVREAVMLMTSRKIGAILVMTEGKLDGIFTERDLTTRVATAGRNLDTTQLEDVMTAGPDTLPPTARAYEALTLMEARRYRHLPVVDNGTVVGMVSIRDLFAVVKTQLLEAVQQRDDFIFGSGYSAGNQPEVTPEAL